MVLPNNFVYVSPTGDDSGSGSIEAPLRSLNNVVSHLSDNSELYKRGYVIYLLPGYHLLSETLDLSGIRIDSLDIAIRFEATVEGQSIIGAGESLQNWQLYDSQKNIYRSPVPNNIVSRQLFVNNRRAQRARTPDGVGWHKNEAGFECPSVVSKWRNLQDVEVVCRIEWKEFRGLIDSYSDFTVVMQQPYWSNAQSHTGFTAGNPCYIENVYEMLTEEGEWYLDKNEGYIYYKPRKDESINCIDARLPVLEQLIRINDSSNISFYGICFSHTTWMQPSTSEGYAIIQSGVFARGKKDSFEHGRETAGQIPGGIDISYSDHVLFRNCVFCQMGAAAVFLDRGTKRCAFINNTFIDISGHALFLGRIDDHHCVPEDIVEEIVIDRNYFTDVGCEFHEGIPIAALYVANVFITRNEICDIPYTGISVGWGWGLHDTEIIDPYFEGMEPQFSTPTIMKNNIISGNLIYRHMNTLRDGGGIYLLSAQPGTVVSYNCIHNQLEMYGAIYLDSGCRYMDIAHNAYYDNMIHTMLKGKDNHFVGNFLANGWEDIPSYIKERIGRDGVCDLLPDWSASL